MSRRDLAALITVVVVAVPGLAVAQQTTSPDPEPEQTETEDPAEVEAEDDTQDLESDAGELTAEDTGADTEDTAEVEEVEDPEAEGVEDDGHGELVSALARCLPSGRELHGTGLTKGAVLSQVASTGTFTAEGGSPTEVTTPEDVETLCTEVQELADAAQAPETAKGRPSWAGAEDGEEADTEEAPDAELEAEAEDDGETEDEADDDTEATAAEDDRGGPPDHAAAKGHRGR